MVDNRFSAVDDLNNVLEADVLGDDVLGADVLDDDPPKSLARTLPGTFFREPEEPADLIPIDYSGMILDSTLYADRFTPKVKTEKELEAMFPNTSFKSDKYRALAKAGLALMQPTINGSVAPAIANAGTQLLNEVGAIKAVERKQEQANRQGKLSVRQQEEAQRLQATAQVFGLNYNLGIKDLEKNYEARAKKSAAMWDAYNKTLNTNYEKALEFGMSQYQSKPVTIRYLDKGRTVERAGFLQDSNYYVPTNQRNPEGDWIYDIVPSPETVEIISSKNQDVKNVSKNMQIYNEDYADFVNLGKNIYSLDQIMQNVDPEKGGDPTRVAFTGYIRRNIQKYRQIASDFTKDFFKQEHVFKDGTVREAQRPEQVVWISDVADIVLSEGVAGVDGDGPTEATIKSFGHINDILDSVEADGMAYIARAQREDLSRHFEGNTDAERQKNKNLIFSRLQFDRKIPENEARAQAIIYALARARKASGRLNLDDIERAAETLNIYGDSSEAILAKLGIVRQDLLSAYNIRRDLLKRNFAEDAANIADERGGSLEYSSWYYDNMFGTTTTPFLEVFDVSFTEDGRVIHTPKNRGN